MYAYIYGQSDDDCVIVKLDPAPAENPAAQEVKPESQEPPAPAEGGPARAAAYGGAPGIQLQQPFGGFSGSPKHVFQGSAPGITSLQSQPVVKVKKEFCWNGTFFKFCNMHSRCVVSDP